VGSQEVTLEALMNNFKATVSSPLKIMDALGDLGSLGLLRLAYDPSDGRMETPRLIQGELRDW
jgi:hypothetical protein